MRIPRKNDFPGEFEFLGKFKFLGNITKPVYAAIYIPGNKSSWEMILNQFMQLFILQERRIPRKCDFPGKFEFLGAFKFLGNVTIPVYAAIYVLWNNSFIKTSNS